MFTQNIFPYIERFSYDIDHIIRVYDMQNKNHIMHMLTRLFKDGRKFKILNTIIAVFFILNRFFNYMYDRLQKTHIIKKFIQSIKKIVPAIERKYKKISRKQMGIDGHRKRHAYRFLRDTNRYKVLYKWIYLHSNFIPLRSISLRLCYILLDLIQFPTTSILNETHKYMINIHELKAQLTKMNKPHKRGEFYFLGYLE